MKIEKVNDRQIRCTLTRADLAEREMKISELAYGSEKAKNLFRDMMRQASRQFGFEAEDIPIMIEAIPLSGEAIVLIITKVEDPEELDTRFSRFAPSVRDDMGRNQEEITTSGADDVLELFHRLRRNAEPGNEKPVSDRQESGLERLQEIAGSREGRRPSGREETASQGRRELSDGNSGQAEGENASADLQLTVPEEISKLYSFRTLEGAIHLAHILSGYYDGENSLYRDSADGHYYLIVRKSGHTPQQFNKICNIITEYAEVDHYIPAADAYFREHGDPVISGHALQALSLL